MKKIGVFGASTSKNSINKQLATYAAGLVNNIAFDVLDLNDYEVPVFSEDIEKGSVYPEGATKFNETLDQYDGFIVSLAEHNGSYAAAFKNLFDWVSRKNREVFRNKPVLLMATSPGGRGGATVLAAGKATFPHMGASITSEFSLPKFYDNFKEGKLANDEYTAALESATAAFEKSLS